MPAGYTAISVKPSGMDAFHKLGALLRGMTGARLSNTEVITLAAELLTQLDEQDQVCQVRTDAWRLAWHLGMEPAGTRGAAPKVI